MDNTSIFKNKVKIASALNTVVAGMLTDLLYDILADEHFEGSMIDDVIRINRISEYTPALRIVFICGVFLLLWIFFSFVLPLLSYYIASLWHRNMPKHDKEEALRTYRESKETTVILQERIQKITKEENYPYVVIFSNACLLIDKLHDVFCSEKQENRSIIRNIFRRGTTINDMQNRISPYEYIALIEAVKSVLNYSYTHAHHEPNGLMEKDYKQIECQLNELIELPKTLNISAE